MVDTSISGKPRSWPAELARQCPVGVALLALAWMYHDGYKRQQEHFDSISKTRIEACHEVQNRSITALDRVKDALSRNTAMLDRLMILPQEEEP